MLSRLPQTAHRTLLGTLAACALLLATTLSVTAQPALDGPTEYRDCWLSSPTQYDACIEANTWGTIATYSDWNTAYRDCWLGSLALYDACVEANNWGAAFVFDTPTTTPTFPDRDDTSLVIDGIPSY